MSEFLPPVFSAYLRARPDVNIGLRERLSGEVVRSEGSEFGTSKKKEAAKRIVPLSGYSSPALRERRYIAFRSPSQSNVIVSLKVVSAAGCPGAPGSTNTRLM